MKLIKVTEAKGAHLIDGRSRERWINVDQIQWVAPGEEGGAYIQLRDVWVQTEEDMPHIHYLLSDDCSQADHGHPSS